MTDEQREAAVAHAHQENTKRHRLNSFSPRDAHYPLPPQNTPLTLKVKEQFVNTIAGGKLYSCPHLHQVPIQPIYCFSWMPHRVVCTQCLPNLMIAPWGTSCTICGTVPPNWDVPVQMLQRLNWTFWFTLCRPCLDGLFREMGEPYPPTV